MYIHILLDTEFFSMISSNSSDFFFDCKRAPIFLLLTVFNRVDEGVIWICFDFREFNLQNCIKS